MFGDERLPRRFWAKVRVLDSGCWEWTAARSHFGYGRIKIDRTIGHKYAHRIAYAALIGDVPEGLMLDHLCRHPWCVNPAHLEPVTPQENVLRGAGRAANLAQQTHCKRGHEFTPENTYRRGNSRQCRQCVLDTTKARRADPEKHAEILAVRREWRKRRHADTEWSARDAAYQRERRARIRQRAS